MYSFRTLPSYKENSWTSTLIDQSHLPSASNLNKPGITSSTLANDHLEHITSDSNPLEVDSQGETSNKRYLENRESNLIEREPFDDFDANAVLLNGNNIDPHLPSVDSTSQTELNPPMELANELETSFNIETRPGVDDSIGTLQVSTSSSLAIDASYNEHVVRTSNSSIIEGNSALPSQLDSEFEFSPESLVVLSKSTTTSAFSAHSTTFDGKSMNNLKLTDITNDMHAARLELNREVQENAHDIHLIVGSIVYTSVDQASSLMIKKGHILVYI